MNNLEKRIEYWEREVERRKKNNDTLQRIRAAKAIVDTLKEREES